MRCSSPSRCSASRRSRSSRRWLPTGKRCVGGFAPPRPRRSWRSNEERVRFSHPLLAARVEAELDPRRRRSLHRRLAELVGDPEQRARHLALGANGASARVAEELETASVTAAARGASGAAAELAELSVSLTPVAVGGRVRRRRQLLAAGHHSRAATRSDPERSSSRCSSSCSRCRARGGACSRLGEPVNHDLRTVGAAPGAGVPRGRVRSAVEGGDRHTAYRCGVSSPRSRRRP